MSVQPLESRLAHMEGVNEQIVERLGGVDRQIDGVRSEVRDLRSDMNARFAQVDVRFNQIDLKFTWMIGLNIASWTTLMVAIFFKH